MTEEVRPKSFDKRVGRIEQLNKKIRLAHIVEEDTAERFFFSFSMIADYHGEYPEELKRFGPKGLNNKELVLFKVDQNNYVIEGTVEPLNAKPEKKYCELSGFALWVRNLQLCWYELKYKYF